MRLLQEMANNGVQTLPGDLKTTLRSQVTEKPGTEPEHFEEDLAEGAQDVVAVE